jgi:hypothetical protein
VFSWCATRVPKLRVIGQTKCGCNCCILIDFSYRLRKATEAVYYRRLSKMSSANLKKWDRKRNCLLSAESGTVGHIRPVASPENNLKPLYQYCCPPVAWLVPSAPAAPASCCRKTAAGARRGGGGADKFQSAMLLRGVFIGWSHKTVKFFANFCRNTLWVICCFVMLINGLNQRSHRLF